MEVAREVLVRGLSTGSEVGTPEHDIVRWRIGRRVSIGLGHPDYVDHVLHEGADRYHKSIEYELLRAVVGLSLFTDEDESWRRYRQMLAPVMSKRHLRGLGDLMIDPIERFVATLDTGATRTPVEMSQAMTALTLDVVGAALFGQEMGSLAERIGPTVTSALHAAEFGARLMTIFDPPTWMARTAVGAIRHAPWLPPPVDRPQRAMRIIERTVAETIEHRRTHPSDSPDLLGLLLSASDEQGALTPRRVRDEATTFMLAGHETTANALTWMWYLLALNPDARELMLAEVDAALENGRRPTIADVERLPWTTACFQEAMRVMPPAWVIPRRCVQEDEIDGYRIPRGATVFVPIHGIHHDPRFWPDPDVYDPARFLPENAKGQHRSAYLPFGGGRRICIGSSFALMEGTLITAMMSQAFVYDLVPGHPVEPEATLTLRPRRGVKMVARRRTRVAVAA
jgi:cytochrome P450